MPDPPMIAPERAMVFIDLMNLYESMGDLSINTNLDYSKFAAKLVEPHRRLIRCPCLHGGL